MQECTDARMYTRRNVRVHEGIRMHECKAFTAVSCYVRALVDWQVRTHVHSCIWALVPDKVKKPRPSPLGRLLVAATDRGVCLVAMGASDAELHRALLKEYPLACVAEDHARLREWTRRVLAHLSDRMPRIDPARYSGHRVSVAGVECARVDSPWRNGLLFRSGRDCRASPRSSRGRARLDEPSGDHHSLPSRGAACGRRWRLSMGGCAQEMAASRRAGSAPPRQDR